MSTDCKMTEDEYMDAVNKISDQMVSDLREVLAAEHVIDASNIDRVNAWLEQGGLYLDLDRRWCRLLEDDGENPRCPVVRFPRHVSSGGFTVDTRDGFKIGKVYNT